MIPRQLPYIEHWPARACYLFALVGALQFYTWSRNLTELSQALVLLALWVVYAVPNIMIESSLGWNLGPPDAYLSAIPSLRGCLVPLMVSLFIGIPFYAANSAYSAISGYQLITNITNQGVSDVSTLLSLLSDTNATVPSWEVPKLMPSDVSISGGVAVALVWLVIGIGCSLGPLSLGWVMVFVSSVCTVMSIVLLGYLVYVVPGHMLASQFVRNVNVTQWTTYDCWRWCLTYANRQSMIGYGIFGMFAAYSATMSRGKRDGRWMAVCQTVFVCGYPFVWLAMTISKDSIQLVLRSDGQVNLTATEAVKIGQWVASYRLLQALMTSTTVMCMFEVWCNTWVRCMRSAFPFRFRQFYIYRPVVCLLNVLIFGGLTIISTTREGQSLYRNFHQTIVPFVFVELSQICIFAGMQYTQIWDNLSRGTRRRSAKSVLCTRLPKTLLLTLLTSVMIVACIWRGVIFIEHEVIPQTTHQGWKIAIIAVPLVIAVVVSTALALKDKSTGCRRLFCPAVIPSRAARGAGFFPGIANTNANEHYWPDEFEVLPYDEQQGNFTT